MSNIRERSTSAKKEIESWAKEGQKSVTLDCCRQSGLLMDNVTQQRLLNTKLWDLSKERHRFLSENAFDKKMFLKKQARKSTVFKGMLEGFNTNGTRVSYSEDVQRMRAGLRGPESIGTRMALLEGMEPKKSKLQKDSSNNTDNNSLQCVSTYNSNSKIVKSVKFNREPLIVTPKSHFGIKRDKMAKIGICTMETIPTNDKIDEMQ